MKINSSLPLVEEREEDEKKHVGGKPHGTLPIECPL
jgi:hypothetical protein